MGKKQVSSTRPLAPHIPALTSLVALPEENKGEVRPKLESRGLGKRIMPDRLIDPSAHWGIEQPGLRLVLLPPVAQISAQRALPGKKKKGTKTQGDAHQQAGDPLCDPQLRPRGLRIFRGLSHDPALHGQLVSGKLSLRMRPKGTAKCIIFIIII